MRWGCHGHLLKQRRSLMKLTLSRNIIATSSKRKMLSPYSIHRETPLRPSVLNVYQYTYLYCSLSLHVLAVYDSVGSPTHTTNSMVSSSGLPHSSIKACEYQIASYIKTSIISIDRIHTKWEKMDGQAYWQTGHHIPIFNITAIPKYINKTSGTHKEFLCVPNI